MAVAARQVQIAKGDDHVVAVERNVVYDPETGIAAQVEKTTVAVDLGDGRVGIAQQQKVTGVRVEAGRTQQPSRPALTYHQRTDPPPSYRARTSSTVGGVRNQVRDAKTNSSNQGSFLLDLCNIFTGKICFLVCMLLLVALPVAMIVIGAVYFHQCQGQGYIPIWLVVFGGVAVVQLTVSVMKWCICRKKDDDSGNSCLRNSALLLETLCSLFLFAWLITGSVWVFGYFPEYLRCVDNTPFDVGCCHPVPFLFSFVSVIVIYVIGFLACACICCCCCLLFLAPSNESTV